MKLKKFSLSGIKFSAVELQQLFIAAIALAFAFSLILYREEIFAGGFAGLLRYNPIYLVYSLVAVGMAFIFHELGHKIVAQRKGCWAEFRMWPVGLLLAVGMAMLTRGGFVFAAPGAVMISPAQKTRFGYAYTLLNKEDIGKIGAAGPLVNIVQAAAFGVLALFSAFPLWSLAAMVNAWLAIFNMIPFGMLDGAKIMRWNVGIWIGMLLLSVVLFGLVMFI